MTFESTHDRRRVLKTVGAALVVSPLLAGCTANADESEPATTAASTPTTTSASNADAPSADFDGWLDGVDDSNTVVDQTGESTVEIGVGAAGNGGNFAFDPVAVRVDAGTTVVWTWTGKGSMHNVAATDGTFESEMSGQEGFTFEHTFDESGAYKYVCTPHESLDMKGVVVVE